MDRDTVRLLLIISALIVLAGIYLWGRFSRPLLDRLRGKPDLDLPFDHDTGDAPDEDMVDLFEEEIRVITPGSGGRREPQLSGLDFDEPDALDLERLPEHNDAETAPEPAASPNPGDSAGGAPFLIQISVVAGPGRFFHGPDLKQALLDVDLLFGDMGIFHRYNRELTQTLFSVASLVEPGTFPIDDMDDFECPGIVLFFQTARVSDPLDIYDDLVNTSRELAQRLHGIQWDETRQPLSASKIAHMRNLLKQPLDSAP